MADGTIRSMRWLVAIGLAVSVCLVVGCRGREEETVNRRPPSVKVDPSKPEDTLYEQLRAGSFQIGGVIETVAVSLEKLREIKPGNDPDLKAALADVTEGLDSAGAALADFEAEPPAREAVAKRFAELDDHRIKAIQAGNEALHDLAEVAGIAEELAASKKVSLLGDVADLLLVAIEDLQEAIIALGGKLEE